jgi:hypothetical protein
LSVFSCFGLQVSRALNIKSKVFDHWEPIPKEFDAYGGLEALQGVLSPLVNVRPRDVSLAFLSGSGSLCGKFYELPPSEELDAHEEFDIDRFEEQDGFLLRAYFPSKDFEKNHSGLSCGTSASFGSFIPPMPDFIRK